ncbi:hypothetical protein LO80_06545 [Candidatus Francisella endociliophora]|uniref:Uncharacterized protein n=1 Tax=Candidatus Francisella endociliophora TaxID=653937 RepID=A0A097ERW6_9GAMM|nr:hypothetical protein LO80_06545 [Francisella sp. FSC1006]
MFTFKSEKIKYDPTAVLKGIVDHYRNHNPQYKIIPKNNLINPSKSKSIELSDSEYCYNLGYSIFEIPKNYLDSNFIDEDAFIDGLTAGLNNKKLNLSSNELNETSYIMGCLLYEPEFFNFKNISDKNNFLKGFYDESQTNDL